MAPAVSVVIPTCDKPERLRLTLYALVGQRLPGARVEVLVVADGCTYDPRPDVETVRALGLDVAVVETARIGQAAARNLGAARAKGDVLLFADDDVLLSPGYVAACWAACCGRPDLVVRAPVYMLRYVAAFRDPESGLPYSGAADRFVSSPLAAERISRDMVINDWDGIARRCIHQNRFERLVSDALRADPPRYPWLGYSGSGVALDRGLFARAGGYDEGFGLLWGAEAVELGYRLHRMGARVIEAEGIYSAHMDHPRGASMRTFDQSFDLFFRKHGDPAIREVQALILGPDRRPSWSAPMAARCEEGGQPLDPGVEGGGLDGT